MKLFAHSLLFICFLSCLCTNSKAQEINGDTIYVDATAEIAIRFPSLPTNRNVTPEHAPYNLKTLGNGFTIIAKEKNTKPAYLTVIEDKRTHHFILVYKKNIDYSNLKLMDYDYSTLKKLKEHVKQQDDKEKEYASTMQAAEKAMESKDYEKAKMLYEQAIGLFKRSEPKDQLKKLAKLIKKEKRKQKNTLP